MTVIRSKPAMIPNPDTPCLCGRRAEQECTPADCVGPMTEERADARIAELSRWHDGDDDVLVRPGSDIGLLLQTLSIRAVYIASLTETIARLQRELDAGRRWASQYERDHGPFKNAPPDHLLTF
jgi:hypothetical protein